MEARMLDGNAVAGLLREVFAVEMTTAIGTCNRCGASEHTALFESSSVQAPSFAAPTATTRS